MAIQSIMQYFSVDARRVAASVIYYKNEYGLLRNNSYCPIGLMMLKDGRDPGPRWTEESKKCPSPIAVAFAFTGPGEKWNEIFAAANDFIKVWDKGLIL